MKKIAGGLAQNLEENQSGLREENNPKGENGLIHRIIEFIDSKWEMEKNILDETILFKEKRSKGKFNQLNERTIWRILQENGFKVSRTFIEDLLHSEPDFIPNVNPIIDYFDSLRQPGPHAVSEIKKLCDSVNVNHQDFFHTIFKKWLVKCVACSTLHPHKISNDHVNRYCLTLIGGQNCGKTFFLKFLCPDELINHYTQDYNVKKAQEHDGTQDLATKFLINLDDLHNIPHAYLPSVKNAISQPSVNYRKKFAKQKFTERRNANFCATANGYDYLNDLTGNDRFLTFEFLGYKVEYWKKGRDFVNINKIWGEAKYLLDTGFNYNFTDDEKRKMEELNESFRYLPIEEELCKKWLSEDKEKDIKNHKTTNDILMFLRDKTTLPQNINDRTLGRVLTKLKYTRVNIRKPGYEYPIGGYFVRFREVPPV